MGGNAGQNIAGRRRLARTGRGLTEGRWPTRCTRSRWWGPAGGAYWVEPASRASLTREGFSAWGLFEVVRDDAPFAAAQVSVGALGW
ncbi:MAG: hypothetical protein R3F14_26190 [Polyangiaceae bacterium]